ncbi:oxidoreductase [Streptomyces viridiviolaceus]|uniref:Aldo/keto reductase n=1 Tax=Streptomyces viridiviolaceus TaxID=68282 RepID=A0ABW2E0S2_9ACTN|nr:aldo/keto reductase [Streptomyces viridiviolaceus]GHB16783.1 oxidoreductase [Streptomyces viridiviolaceus]
MDSARSVGTHVTLGEDLTVGRLGFGALRLTGPHHWGPPARPDKAMEVARRAVELGVTFIDTADVYGLGANEELLASALHPYAPGLVVSTKAGEVRPGPHQWRALGRPDYLRQQAELSLRRLRLECVELFQLHRVDPQVPLEDQVGALKQLQEEGKVRHIGLSEVTVDQLERAREIVPVVSVQNKYSLYDRRHEKVLDHCAQQGIAFIAWKPLAGTVRPAPDSALARVAAEVGATTTQVALAWLLHRSPVLLPIPGTASMSHLRANMAAAGIALTDEQLALLNEE